MKYNLALIGATSAARLQKGPPFFNEPTWTEDMASAGGFAQQ